MDDTTTIFGMFPLKIVSKMANYSSKWFHDFQFISSIEESMSPTPSQVSSVVIYMKLRFNFPGEVIRPFHKLI